MLSNDVVIRRLALIKYLYGVGIEQSQKPEPLCVFSILTFHDAVELFLQLAVDYHNVKKQKAQISFMEYWTLLSPKIPKGGPTQQLAMERLNKARVGLKHYGILPSKFQIESFRASATNFFEENTHLIFKIDFSAISLIDLIQYKETKSHLKEAISLLNKNDIIPALDKTAIAFSLLIYDYYKSIRKTDQPLSAFNKSIAIPSNFHINLNLRNSMKTEKKLSDFANEVKTSLANIKDIIEILVLGIDYRKYVKFHLLTPTVLKSGSGKYSICRSGKTVDLNDAHFCIDFVIESAVILQESRT